MIPADSDQGSCRTIETPYAVFTIPICTVMCVGAPLQRSVGVQVQILFAPQLEFGVVDEVFDDQQGSQPLVRLTSGTVGAVRLPLYRFMHCIMSDALTSTNMLLL